MRSQAGKPHIFYHQRGRRCYDSLALRPVNFTTGVLTAWHSPESVSPVQAIVHKVATYEQFTRVHRLLRTWRNLASPCLTLPMAIKYRAGKPATSGTEGLQLVWPSEARHEPQARFLLQGYWRQDRY